MSCSWHLSLSLCCLSLLHLFLSLSLCALFLPTPSYFSLVCLSVCLSLSLSIILAHFNSFIHSLFLTDLGAVFSDPEMDIIQQFITTLVLVGLSNKQQSVLYISNCSLHEFMMNFSY